MKAKPTRLLYYYPGKYDAQYMLEMDNGWYYLAFPKQNTAYVFNQPLSLPSFYMGATWPKSSDELSPETKKEILDTIKNGKWERGSGISPRWTEDDENTWPKRNHIDIHKEIPGVKF